MWMMGVWWTTRFVTLRNKNQSPCEELFRYTCLSLQPRTLGLPWQLVRDLMLFQTIYLLTVTFIQFWDVLSKNFWLSWIVLPGGIQARSVSCSFVKEVANHGRVLGVEKIVEDSSHSSILYIC
ncbi:hypothetical protein LINPERHAP2_LOCUS10790 [Linum perenne]